MKKKKMRFKTHHYILLSLPLVLAIGWAISIITSQKLSVTETGIKLSPIVNTAPLLRGLAIFIGAYIAFLATMFHEYLRDLFGKLF